MFESCPVAGTEFLVRPQEGAVEISKNRPALVFR